MPRECDGQAFCPRQQNCDQRRGGWTAEGPTRSVSGVHEMSAKVPATARAGSVQNLIRKNKLQAKHRHYLMQEKEEAKKGRGDLWAILAPRAQRAGCRPAAAEPGTHRDSSDTAGCIRSGCIRRGNHLRCESILGDPPWSSSQVKLEVGCWVPGVMF